MTLEALNHLSRAEAALVLSRCCGSAQWTKQMSQKRPFGTRDELFRVAASVWERLSPHDWKEAFSCHPRIGDLHSPQLKSAATNTWTHGEQAGTRYASGQTLHALAAGNAEYEKRFGYIFIVCATGKSADEMLSILNQRLRNDPADEIKIAAAEQGRIMQVRLNKLLDDKEP